MIAIFQFYQRSFQPTKSDQGLYYVIQPQLKSNRPINLKTLFPYFTIYILKYQRLEQQRTNDTELKIDWRLLDLFLGCYQFIFNQMESSHEKLNLKSTVSLRKVMDANEEMIYSQSKLIKKLFYDTEDRRAVVENLERQVKEAQLELKSDTNFEQWLNELVEHRHRVDSLSNQLVNTDIVKINCTTEIEVVRKEMKLVRKRSKRSSFHETDHKLTKIKIYKLIEQQVLKINLVISSNEQVQEIHQKMWTKGLEEYGSKYHNSPSKFIEQFKPIIKKHFIPHCFRKQVWPILAENHLFIRKQYYNELVDRLHQVPDKVSKAISRDLDRTLTSDSNIGDAVQLKEDLLLLLSLFHLHRPDISYVQGIIYPIAVLIANMEKFDAFSCFCNIMATEFVNVLYCFDIHNVSMYCRVFDELLVTQDKKLAEHLQSMKLCSEAFIVEWFYTFFCRRFRFDNLCKLWDLFLVYSYRVFFRLPILIITRLKNKLMNSQDYAVLLEIIRCFNQHLDELELLKAVSQFNLRSSQIAEVVERIKQKDKKQNHEKE